MRRRLLMKADKKEKGYEHGVYKFTSDGNIEGSGSIVGAAVINGTHNFVIITNIEQKTDFIKYNSTLYDLSASIYTTTVTSEAAKDMYGENNTTVLINTYGAKALACNICRAIKYKNRYGYLPSVGELLLLKGLMSTISSITGHAFQNNWHFASTIYSIGYNYPWTMTFPNIIFGSTSSNKAWSAGYYVTPFLRLPDGDIIYNSQI